ncbi:MAG: SET domain-containing protein-lysine N-methyltransferase [Verrucomicrobiota bacterium]
MPALNQKPGQSLWVEKKSKIHGTGIFAATTIPKNTRIIEYVGEKLTKTESEKRAAKQIKRSKKKSSEGAVYIFEINSRHDIDGNVKWNPARFINHSCDPNCETLNDNNRIWIESIRKIRKGEELSYNYGYDVDSYADHPCHCGSKNCVGYIVRKDQWKKLKKLIKKEKK